MFNIQKYNSQCPVWGISATIGNLEEAKEVLLAPLAKNWYALLELIIDKKIEVHSIIPDEISEYPWAGHLGIKLGTETHSHH